MEQNLPAAIFEAAKLYPDKPALLKKVNGRWMPLTFAELTEHIRRCAAGLERLGVRPGDRVGVLAWNGPAWVVADLGTMLIGGVVVPVHTSFSPELIRYVLDNSGVQVLVVSGRKLLERTLAIIDKLPFLRHVVLVDVAAPPSPPGVTMHAWEQLLQEPRLGQPVSLRRNDPASIVYTSGTTGLPKGVVLTHGNFLSNMAAALSAVPVYAEDILLSFLPLSHVLERTAGYYVPLSQGAEIAYAESPATLKENLVEVRPTILISVPRIFEKFNDAIWVSVSSGPRFRKSLLTWALRQRKNSRLWIFADRLVFSKIRSSLGGRLRLTICGGASLHVPLAKFFDRIGIRILEGYGLTETSPVISVNTIPERRFGSVGLPLPGVVVRIAADKEILVRGENICLGYWHDSDATAELIDVDGFLHTGDLGFVDADGFLYITGRRKEMQVTSYGKNIWPTVAENAINGDPLVSQTMVVAHGRPYVTALIVPVWDELQRVADERGWKMDRAQLIGYPGVRELFKQRIRAATTNLADHEQVRRFTLLPQEFLAERDELTPTLKLRRSVIERHHAVEIEAMYRQ